MHLTREADYAVRVMVELAGSPGSIVPSRTIQARQDIPPAYLAKVVQVLRRGGLVRTSRGAGGGVTLASPPEQITLRHVIEAVEGPLALNLCLVAPGACPRDRFCPVHPVWWRIQGLVIRELESRRVPVYCYQCVAGPDLLKVVVEDGVAVGVEPNVDFRDEHQKLYNPDRIKTPMKRTNPRKGRDEDPGPGAARHGAQRRQETGQSPREDESRDHEDPSLTYPYCASGP